MMAEIIHDLPIEDYHADDAVSNSKLKSFCDSGPAYYHACYIAKTYTRPATDALRLGGAFDTLLFDGKDAFDARYVVAAEDYTAAKKDGKEWRDAQTRVIVRHKEYEMFFAMTKNILRTQKAAAYLKAGHKQVTLRAQVSGLPFRVQARPDWINLEAGYILDLKTIDSIGTHRRAQDSRHVMQSVVKYAAYKQAALANLVALAAGVTITKNVLLLVEKAFPCRVKVFELDRTFVEAGYDHAISDLKALAEHYHSGEWPLVDEEEELLVAPGWLGWE